MLTVPCMLTSPYVASEACAQCVLRERLAGDRWSDLFVFSLRLPWRERSAGACANVWGLDNGHRDYIAESSVDDRIVCLLPKAILDGVHLGWRHHLRGYDSYECQSQSPPNLPPFLLYNVFVFLSLMRSAKHSFLSPVFSFCSFGCFPRGFLSLYFLSDSPRPMYMSFFCYGGQGNHIGVPTQSTRCCLPALITAVPCHALPSNAAANCANVLWCRCTAQGLRQIFMLNRRKRQQGVQTYCQPTPSPQRLQREHQCFFRHHPAMMIIAGAVPVAAVVAVAAAVLTVAGCGPVAHNSFRM